VARNRKRAKERRARRPEPVGGRRTERQDPPLPIGHAAPDVELAEAQLAVGRPDLAGETEPSEPSEEGPEGFGPDEEARADGSGGAGSGAGDGAGFGGSGGGGAGDGGAALPAPRERRPNPGVRVINFAQGSWRELQRVQWPDRRQVMQATGVVIGFVIIAGLYLGLADLVASKLMNFILK
jgi:preprotein translocase subunit SecE